LCKVNLQFKSYYVVWKHPVLNCHFFSEPQFKSYYVVWKQLF